VHMPPSTCVLRLQLVAQHLRPAPHRPAPAPAAGGEPYKLVFLGSAREDILRALEANHAPSELQIVTTESDGEAAVRELADADAAYGTLTPALLAAAPRLQWLQCPAAAPVGNYYFDELVASDVTVTNMRGIYDEELSIHMLTLMLGVNRQLDKYHSQQLRHEYIKLPSGGDNPTDGTGAAGVDIPQSTALLVGVGNAGGETARLCKALGMTTLGVDARRTEPHPSVDELHGAEALDDLLPRADFVLSTIPHTPETEGLFDASKFALMKSSAVFVNVGRGATVDLDDLTAALRDGEIGGAGLDVFGSGVEGKPDLEPLPAEHPL
jgi:phosphoglycerate dehydrogenase-like enzyme